jgi:hypothetical protein
MLYKFHYANTTRTLSCFSADLSSVATKPVTPILSTHQINKEHLDYSTNNLNKRKQDRQRQYNVTLRRVCATTIAVEKQ